MTLNNTKLYMLNKEEVIDAVEKTADSNLNCELFDDSRYAIFPGFCDVHVHFREPGFSYKETIGTGSRSAAAGGYTDVCTMPNLKPVPDSLPHLKQQLDIIKRDAVINVHPYGAISVEEKGEKLADMEAMAPYAISFSDDGRGIQDESLMREAMYQVKELGKILVAHCEVESLVKGGYIHDGEYARQNNHLGICSESEWREVERDIKLADETGCPFHACHISSKESVELIRDAKKSGVDVTCETAPHYLIMNDMDLKEDGWYKMNPPIRSRQDQEALIEGILDGSVDMIATDHAPHTLDEKNKGLKDSYFGIVGLETAFPLLYTKLVLEGVLSLEQLIKLMTKAPRERFGIKRAASDFTIFDLEKEYEIRSDEFLTKGRAMPFEGEKVKGQCMLTLCNGKIAYRR